MQVVPVHECHSDTGAAGAASAAHTVQVRLVVLGNRVVDHVGHVVDIDTACGDVGGDQDVLFASLERGHRALARLLAHVTVDGNGLESAVLKFLSHLRRRALGAREDNRLASTLGHEDTAYDLVFVQVVGAVHDVVDVRLSQALVGILRPNVDGLRHESTR